MGFPSISDDKESACNAKDLGSIPGSDPWVGKIPLEEGMATHSNILAWRFLRTEEPGSLPSMGLQESDMTWQPNYHHTYFIFHKFVEWVLLAPYINEKSVFQKVKHIAQDHTAC